MDPFQDVAPYLEASRDTGMRIHVIDTHVHADHLSGGRALADAAGASYLVHESIDTADDSRLRDAQELSIGNVTIRVLHTPGHTPEHLSLLVTDRTRGSEPWFVLTGHTLMVGDMGRTELATSAETGAQALFESAARLRALPDHVEVWPGAFAGSVCGRRLSGKPASTIGFECRFIGALISSAIFFYRNPELPIWRTADLCGPTIALGQAIGRVGCFMTGDDFGRPSNVPWAVTFTDPDAARIGGAPLGVAVHPVQLYESVVCLVLFFVLVRLSRRKTFDGQVVLSYTMLYGAARFLLEFFRGDADRGFVFGGLLSTSQFIAVILMPFAGVLWLVRRRANT